KTNKLYLLFKIIVEFIQKPVYAVNTKHHPLKPIEVFNGFKLAQRVRQPGNNEMPKQILIDGIIPNVIINLTDNQFRPRRPYLTVGKPRNKTFYRRILLRDKNAALFANSLHLLICLRNQ